MTIRGQAKALHVCAKSARKALAIQNSTAVIKTAAERINGAFREAICDA